VTGADRLRILSAAGPRDDYGQPSTIDILLVTRAMRVRMPHCELKLEMSVNGKLRDEGLLRSWL